mgnify:CR=1 FL=1
MSYSMSCSGKTKAGTACTRKAKENGLCWQHQATSSDKAPQTQSKRKIDKIIGDVSLFDTADPVAWEAEYQRIITPKYKKGTRKFSTEIKGKKIPTGQVPLYLIERERAGPSYKSYKLVGVNSEDIYYAPISKGFSMQDLSSFSLGPIVGSGLCLVNAAFSKCIHTMHLEGGFFNSSRKNFWQKARKKTSSISVISEERISVDDVEYNTRDWLEDNKEVWFPEWLKWSQAVAMCSVGDFHWGGDTPCVAYYYQGKYLDFVTWKKECYIKPSYELLSNVKAYQFLEKIYKEERIALGLVHPKAHYEGPKYPITKEEIQEIFESEYAMCCQPFVIAGKLLGVSI